MNKSQSVWYEGSDASLVYLSHFSIEWKQNPTVMFNDILIFQHLFIAIFHSEIAAEWID